MGRCLLTIANAWLRVEQEQEADDFASAFVTYHLEVSSLAFCAVQKAEAGRPAKLTGRTGPNQILFGGFCLFAFHYAGRQSGWAGHDVTG